MAAPTFSLSAGSAASSIVSENSSSFTQIPLRMSLNCFMACSMPSLMGKPSTSAPMYSSSARRTTLVTMTSMIIVRSRRTRST